jgi:hypothetical protein
MVHVGNLLVSEDGAFATYKCKTIQDIMWSDDQWKRTGQSDGCRKREVQLLTKQRDEARERIKQWHNALTPLMPSDFKCWHQNTPNEWPEVAAWVITSQRERIKRLEEAGDEAICPIEYASRARIWTEAKEAKP